MILAQFVLGMAIMAATVGLVTLLSSELAIDILGTSPDSLPRWLRQWGVSRAQAVARDVWPLQIWARRLVSGALLSLFLAPSVVVWLPGWPIDFGFRMVECAGGVVSAVWLIFLVRLPRGRPISGTRDEHER